MKFSALRLLLLVVPGIFPAAFAETHVAVPRLTHPGAGHTLYFVLTDRFENGNPANDTGGYAGERGDHGFDPTSISHYHGGDFAGLTARLDYLQQLGMEAIWVTPPFRNKPVQQGTAGYHGYWILDFLAIDPHLGTDAEFREFVRQAHARGIRVILDIIVNHTADVIGYRGGHFDYRPLAEAPDRDSEGNPIDLARLAYNGIGPVDTFPALSAERSFAYVPEVPPAEARAKNPAWLNDVTLYHNRGNSTFRGENSLYGDFVGLDDTMTEHPRVVQGFIEIFTRWLVDYGVDGFRIDTTKHANLEFWQAFGPAIRAVAREQGRDDFISFGEVSASGDSTAFLSEYSTLGTLDGTLDFAFQHAARDFVSRGASTRVLEELFAKDDYYTDHDSNVHNSVTFLGNHDGGRFGGFLREDNHGADDARLLQLMRLGHALMFFVRGLPPIYYGDEQGLSTLGEDRLARETMFASRAAEFRERPLIGTTRTGADDKFDPAHPLYREIAKLAQLRREHPALARGAMIVRPANHENVFAFSRIERGELIEYLVAANNARDTSAEALVATSQPAGAKLELLYATPESGQGPDRVVTVDGSGRARVRLGPLQMAAWRATESVPSRATVRTVSFQSPARGAALSFSPVVVDGQEFPSREKFEVAVEGGDGVGEVTFALERASRPGQFELLGTDDAPPYRIFWRPPADLRPGETFSLLATFDDLRGARRSTRLDGLAVAAASVVSGIRGADTPSFVRTLPRFLALAKEGGATLSAEARGTAPLEYRWFKDSRELTGATDRQLNVTEPGVYRVGVSNRAGAVMSPDVTVSRE